MSEMHAGDALWFIHAGLQYFEEYQLPRAVIEHLRCCARVIGAHIGVPEPMAADADDLIKQLAQLAGQPQPEQRRSGGGGNKFGDPERIERAKRLLDAMVASDLFDWADMVEDIHQKLQSSSPFMTDKQFRAIVNIAKKGQYDDESMFWDEFQDAYPEAADFAQACADNA